MATGDIKPGGELLNVAGAAAPVDPGWFALQQDDRAQVPFIFSLTAGTATFFLEGRNSPNDAAITLLTGSAAVKALVEKTVYMKCRLSAAAGATAIGSIAVGSLRIP